MELHYRLYALDGRHLASCREVEVEAWGASPVEALGALRRAVRDALHSEEAVAPPSRPDAGEAIDLVEEASPSQSADGPGDVPPVPAPAKLRVPTEPA